MKTLKTLFSVVLVILTISPALAATKLIMPVPMKVIANISPEDLVSGALVKGKTIFVYGSVQGVDNTQGFIEAISDSGATLWSLPLEFGANSIVTSAVFDTAGHIWVVGTAGGAPDLASATPTPTATVLNPDAVTTDPILPLRKDLTTLVLRQVDQSGKLISTFTSELSRSVVARGIAATPTGLAIVGLVATPSGNAGFFLQADYSGTFGSIQVIGVADTELSSIVSTSSGLQMAGSSVEKLLGKPLLGARDAIVVTTTGAGKISSLLRSSNTSTIRSWRSSTPSLFFGGEALLSGKSSAVVTKFSSKMAPTWTTRFPSAGPALVVDAPLSRFMVFASDIPIVGVGGWKPTKASLIALGLDSQGKVKSAFSAKLLSSPIAIGYSTALGLVVLGQTGEKGVSIFHAVTR